MSQKEKQGSSKTKTPDDPMELKGIEPSASRVRFWRSPKLSYSPVTTAE